MMREDQAARPFAELPAALVEEVLARTEDVGTELLHAFSALQRERESFRQGLVRAGLLVRENDLEYPPIPTTCGVDGSYAIERLLAIDLVAAAAVAVEGLTPPSEQRHWARPHHRVFIQSEPHDADTGTIARALMIGMELELAAAAPHDVVLLDGSLTTPLIYFNQALTQVAVSSAAHISAQLCSQIGVFLEAYVTLLSSRRSDRACVGVPKYTTRRELGDQLNWPRQHDDRALLTAVLEPGEFVRPQPLQTPAQPWHLTVPLVQGSERSAIETLRDQVLGLLNEIRVLYYKPHSWLPALRLEVSRAVAENRHRLATLLFAIKHQCASPAILEPYPLYIADRMVKNLSAAVPTFRQIASQHVARTYQGDVSDVFLGLHGYRTESGV